MFCLSRNCIGQSHTKANYRSCSIIYRNWLISYVLFDRCSSLCRVLVWVFTPAFEMVVHVQVLYNRDTGKSRGFAFVTMSNVEDANAVIENLDGSVRVWTILLMIPWSKCVVSSCWIFVMFHSQLLLMKDLTETNISIRSLILAKLTSR